MKLILSIIFLFISFSLVAQEVETIENPVTFHVKIGTWAELPKSVKKLIKSQEMEVVVHGVQELNTVYTLNAYECYKEASKHIQYYIDKGFKDAFVIAFDRGKRVSSAEAKEKTKTICK